MLQMGNKLSTLAREALRHPGEAKSKKQSRPPWVQEEALVPEAMKQHGYLSKSASPTKRFHSPKLWSCTACPPCQAAGSRRISAARESPLRGLEQGSAALWAFQRAVWQLQRIGWALDALRVHPSPRVWEGPWASDSALAGVVGLRMVATITCAMTCNYMVHPRLEGGLFLGRDEGMRLQPKMVALASINPGRLTPAKLHAAFALQGCTLPPCTIALAKGIIVFMELFTKLHCYCHNRDWLPPFCFKKVSLHGPFVRSWRGDLPSYVLDLLAACYTQLYLTGAKSRCFTA